MGLAPTRGGPSGLSLYDLMVATVSAGDRAIEQVFLASYWPKIDPLVIGGGKRPFRDGGALRPPRLVYSQVPTTYSDDEIGVVVGAEAESPTPSGSVGARALVRSLLHDGLLDELGLLVHPLVVGSGKRLFEDLNFGTALELVDSRTLGSGVAFLTYTPARHRGQRRHQVTRRPTVSIGRRA